LPHRGSGHAAAEAADRDANLGVAACITGTAS
jgi:hypothetical protein